MSNRQQKHQERLMDSARASAAAEMAHDLAHQINNPLQSITNTLFLARQVKGVGDEQSLAFKLHADMERLAIDEAPPRITEANARTPERTAAVESRITRLSPLCVAMP